MVNARLHVICGNCGCNDDFEYNFEEDLEGKYFYLYCRNCGTLHDVTENAEPKVRKFLGEEQSE